MRTLSALVLASLIGSAAPVFGHDNSVSMDCELPTRPVKQRDADAWNAFSSDLDVYRACMNDFIKRHHDAADRHRDVANGATDQWNTFVRANLNSPADMPFAPPTAKPFAQ